MTRIALSAIFVLIASIAGAAWASDTPPESSGPPEAPCIGKPTQEQLHACLQEVLDSGVTISLLSCDGRTGDELTECESRANAYQRALAGVSGDPCYGFTGDRLTECQAKTEEKPASEGGSSKKKGGLSKHEGTKMERMSDDEDDEEGPGAATGAGNVRDVKMERMTDDEEEDE